MKSSIISDPILVALQVILLLGILFILYYLIKLYKKIIKYLDKNSK
jgi:hypothetical protein